MSTILERVRGSRPSRARGGLVLWASIVIGLLVFVVVFVAGRRIIESQPARWSAQAAVVVFPDDELDTDLAASYYSTLSQGQIPNTLAEYFRLPGIQNAASEQVAERGVGADDGEVVVNVVEGTSMIMITADASTGRAAELLADTLLDEAQGRIERLPVTRGYQLDVASRAEGTAERSGIDETTFLAVLLLVAAVAAVAAQQVAFQLGSALLRLPAVHVPAAPVEHPVGVRTEAPAREEEEGALFELWGDEPEDDGRQRHPSRR